MYYESVYNWTNCDNSAKIKETVNNVKARPTEKSLSIASFNKEHKFTQTHREYPEKHASWRPEKN